MNSMKMFGVINIVAGIILMASSVFFLVYLLTTSQSMQIGIAIAFIILPIVFILSGFIVWGGLRLLSNKKLGIFLTIFYLMLTTATAILGIVTITEMGILLLILCVPLAGALYSSVYSLSSAKMILYGRSNTNQGSAIGSLMTSSRLPVWLLVLAGYFATMTVTNIVPGLISGIDDDRLEAEYMGYFIGDITGLLSVIALLLFVFRRYPLCLYYLVATAILNLTLTIAYVAGKTENLSSYFYSLQGLESIPYAIIRWTVGWNNINDSVLQVVHMAGSIASLTFCALLLYFWLKRSTP